MMAMMINQIQLSSKRLHRQLLFISFLQKKNEVHAPALDKARALLLIFYVLCRERFQKMSKPRNEKKSDTRDFFIDTDREDMIKYR